MYKKIITNTLISLCYFVTDGFFSPHYFDEPFFYLGLSTIHQMTMLLRKSFTCLKKKKISAWKRGRDLSETASESLFHGFAV